jgi:hypothetical protein
LTAKNNSSVKGLADVDSFQRRRAGRDDVIPRQRPARRRAGRDIGMMPIRPPIAPRIPWTVAA